MEGTKKFTDVLDEFVTVNVVFSVEGVNPVRVTVLLTGMMVLPRNEENERVAV